MGVRGALERPSVALGTRFSANGTAPWASGTPSGLLEQSLWLYLERAPAQMELPEGLLERPIGAIGTVLP